MCALYLDKKVESYKAYLQYPYWALPEVMALLRGYTEFSLFFNLHPSLWVLFGRESYGLIAVPEMDKDYGNTPCYEEMWSAIEKNKICGFPIQMQGCGFGSKVNTTYILSPSDVIAYSVTTGILLPKELQIAAGVYQIHTVNKSISQPEEKEIKREAVALAFWHKYPCFNVSEICRRVSRLKKFPGFDFINDSENRARKVVTNLKPHNGEAHLYVPGVIEKYDEIVAFDFQRLKIVVNTIADLLMLANSQITEQEILQHPLISSYIGEGGKEVEKIVEFSLREIFKILYQINNPPWL